MDSESGRNPHRKPPGRMTLETLPRNARAAFSLAHASWSLPNIVFVLFCSCYDCFFLVLFLILFGI
jgi:hypothetical protein